MWWLFVLVFIGPVAALVLTDKGGYRGVYTQLAGIASIIIGVISLLLWIIIPIPLIGCSLALTGLLLYRRTNSGTRNLVTSLIGLFLNLVGITLFILFINHVF
jgi:hypothetical protein